MAVADSNTNPPEDLPEDPGSSYIPGHSVESFWARVKEPTGDTVELERLRQCDTQEPTHFQFRDDDGNGGSRESTLPPGGRATLKLRKVVGEGGFGQVWEGLQESLGRVIAVKRLKTEVVEARQEDPDTLAHLEKTFRHEALTTATLEHPNIVPVYDLGTDQFGMPLLAMKLVRGKPWDQVLIEDRKMEVPDFLSKHIPILIGVAQAVAFAHSRGVVHRDIKPSQVMLGEFGEVMLMDWGLSLVYEPALAEETPMEHSDFTPWSRFVTSPAGTPSYMAPEQTMKTAERVGPWTDIFLLCGTLYYLLTGTAPHQAEDSRAAFSRAMLCEIQPPDERAPWLHVPVDLARLCLKGLQSDPNERTMTARELVDGLRDYLTGAGERLESVELVIKADRQLARAVAGGGEYGPLSESHTMIERALNLWPQNSEAKALRERIIMRFAMSALQGRDLRLARIEAERLQEGVARDSLLAEIEFQEHEQAEAEKRLERAYRDNRRERLRAEQARSQAEDLISFMLVDLYQTLQPLSRLDLLDQVARRALSYFEEHVHSGQQNTMLRALTFRHIGDVMRNRSRLDEAIKAYDDGRELLEPLVTSDFAPAELRMLLAESLDRKAAVLFEQGRLDDASRMNHRALDLRLKLASEDPSSSAYRNALAFSQHQEGGILWRQGRQVEALASYRSAVSIRRRLLKEEPDNLRLKGDLAYTINSESWVLRALGDIDDALESVECSLKMRLELMLQEPNNHVWEADYAWSLKSKALLLEDRGDWEKALDCFDEALTINERLAKLDPTNTMLQSEKAFPYGGRGRALRALGRLEEARVSYETAVELQMDLVENLRHARHMRDAAFNLVELGGTLLDLDRPVEAEPRTRSAVRIAEQLLREVPHNPTFVELLARGLLELGLCLDAQGRERDAVREWRRGATILDPIMADADFPAYQQDTIARLWLHLGDRERAKPYVHLLREKGWHGPKFVALADLAGV